MYLRYFGLSETPFSITPDPAFVFLSARHRDALAHLLYGIGQGGSGGFVQLTGEVGTGKTTLCRCLLEQVPADTHIALLLNPMVNPRELLAAISEELEIGIQGAEHSSRLLVDGLNRFLLDAHGRGERVVIIVDEAQNLSPEALETVRLLTNLETSKEKLLQVVLLGQPELRELLQRRSLRQLAQRITARFHLTPLGPKETPLYVRHRMQVAGAQRNPFRRGAMKALHQRSQGIPRLINIIADRALVAAYAAEKADVDAAMVHAAANEVQLGEQRVRRGRWPWLAGAASLAAAIVLMALNFDSLPLQGGGSGDPAGAGTEQTPPAAADGAAAQPTGAPSAVQFAQEPRGQAPADAPAQVLDTAWLNAHQRNVWPGYAALWRDAGAATAIQAACDGDSTLGYACVREQGSWSKIRRLGLPVVLQLEGDSRSYLLLLGMDGERLLVGSPEQPLTITRQAVDAVWLGSYLAAWPQAPNWPATVRRGDSGPAVKTIMEMAGRVDLPYHGGQLFDAGFERWLRGFQLRNGLQVDGIVGRNTLLHLMTASIDEPHLLRNWE